MNWLKDPAIPKLDTLYLCEVAPSTYDICIFTQTPPNTIHPCWLSNKGKEYLKILHFCEITKPSAPVDLPMLGEYKTYADWQSAGRQVRRGEKSTRQPGYKLPVFHINQTDVIKPRVPKVVAPEDPGHEENDW